MNWLVTPGVRLSDRDLDFVVEQVAVDVEDRAGLRRLIQEDEEFRKGFVGDPRVFDRLMSDDEAFISVSPALYFEVLLRRALTELGGTTHTVERMGSQSVPVFDAASVVDLLAQPGVLYYLADMLGSFTRVRTSVTRVRVRRGLWRKVRYSDLDVSSLIQYASTLDEQHRFPIYKRIGDVCLFILGVFPEHAPSDRPHPLSGASLQATGSRMRRGAEEYEEDGRRFYLMAAGHATAKEMGISVVLQTLHDDFGVARKPLTFLGEHYLRGIRRRMFGSEAAE
ncbi:MAG: hypothetical protein C1O27_002009 [Chloroflexi bacterium]|nr:MAG: hypothetical protein C1O27_002009 [Chloroflexota bacterium]